MMVSVVEMRLMTAMTPYVYDEAMSGMMRLPDGCWSLSVEGMGCPMRTIPTPSADRNGSVVCTPPKTPAS